MSYLIKYQDNYDDEFDIEGGFVVEEKESFLKNLRRTFEEDGTFSFNFGSNESIDYNSYEDIISKFTITSITKEQEKVLRKLDLLSYGTFPEPDTFYDD
jgi:hypothetical protein